MNSLPGPQDIGRTVFPNGITPVTRSNFASPSVVLAGIGRRALSTRLQTGLANFASSCCCAAQLIHSTAFRALESIGSLGFGAGTNHINFGDVA